MRCFSGLEIGCNGGSSSSIVMAVEVDEGVRAVIVPAKPGSSKVVVEG